MDPIKAIEDAPSFHARVMNISSRGEDAVARSVLYAVGHRDARHAAAELANEADALIRSLLDRLREAEADARRYRWLRDDATSDQWASFAWADSCPEVDAAIDNATKETP